MPVWCRVLREARWVTSPSRFLADLLHRQCPVPVTVIANPFAFDALPRGRRRKMILTVSRLVPRKGVQYLVEAMRRLPPDWELVVAGDGPYRSALERQAAGLPVRFTGFVSHREVAELYAQAAIFVLPSLVENFPMVLLEAMNAGCAVVTTDACGCGELAEGVGGDGAAREQRGAASCARPPDRGSVGTATPRRAGPGARRPVHARADRRSLRRAAPWRRRGGAGIARGDRRYTGRPAHRCCVRQSGWIQGARSSGGSGSRPRM